MADPRRDCQTLPLRRGPAGSDCLISLSSMSGVFMSRMMPLSPATLRLLHQVKSGPAPFLLLSSRGSHTCVQMGRE